MPACEPWCPLVKIQLKKLAKEAPWILKKEAFAERAAVAGKEVDIYDADWEHAEQFVDARPGLRDVDTETAEERRARAEIATQLALRAHDQLVETDAVDRVSRTVGEPGKMDAALDAAIAVDAVDAAAAADVDAEAAAAAAAAAADEEGDAEEAAAKRDMLDECDPRCPRRISRKERKRRLEERQRIVDNYLLNKGSGYFDDVCTCSLSCVIRALRDDTFVRSILASALLFTLGVKLCEELDAWYMPIRSS